MTLDLGGLIVTSLHERPLVGCRNSSRSLHQRRAWVWGFHFTGDQYWSHGESSAVPHAGCYRSAGAGPARSACAIDVEGHRQRPPS